MIIKTIKRKFIDFYIKKHIKKIVIFRKHNDKKV